MRPLGPHPKDRPNWDSLNAGQRVYSIRQYNIARANRGLFPVTDSPRYQPQREEQVESTYTGQSSYEDDPDLDWDYQFEGDTSSSSVQSTQESIETTDHQSMEVDGPTKRPAESSGAGPSGSGKKKKGMALPGIGSSSDGDPDTGNASTENAIISRQISNIGGFKMVFRKHITLLSYGLGWKCIKFGTGNNSAYYGITSLMNLHVDKPFMYMSPSEFTLLPRNAKVSNLKMNVVMRNPRTAFETNATNTSLATLNQNKFAVKAIGLNKSCSGVNFKVNTNTAKPMDVTGINTGSETYEPLMKALYAQSSKGEPMYQYDYEGIPHAYNNLPVFNNNYYANVMHKGWNDGNYGWVRFNEHIQKSDASSEIGTSFLIILILLIYSREGWLTLPFGHHLYGHFADDPNVSDFNIINAGTSLIASMDTEKSGGKVVRREPAGTVTMSADQFQVICGANEKRYFRPIDVSQYTGRGGKLTGGTVQPSAHVGVYPVPRLTTTTGIVPTEFTDVEVLWDIDTEMVVEFGFKNVPYNV